MGVDFGILGSIEVVAESGPIRLGGRKQRAVLAILLLNANRVVPVEKLADDLYDGAAPPTAVAQVRDHVSQLRKLLEPAADSILETRSPGYLLRVEPDQLDAVRFERMVEQASHELRRGEAEPAARRLREALAIWRGPVLADFAYEFFTQPAIGRLEELRLVALEHRIEADLQLGQDGALAGELEALVAGHPLRDHFRAQLMLALYRSGRQAEAVDLYHTGRRVLVDEFGIEPSAELRELASRMLRQDPSLHSSGRLVAGPAEATLDHEIRNPYKGLHAFLEADAEDFFGREQLTQELVERVAAERFLAVIGPSGSGKSSVVLAGLVPALRAGAVGGSEQWHVVELSAGAYPVEELEAALLRIAVNPPPSLMEQLAADELGLLRAVKRVLPDDGSELLLVVDQLEEVFTLVEDDARRAQFLSMLERAVRDPHSRLRVVTTLRADFYDRPLLYRDFAELLRGRVETVLPLSPDELERAIAGPARQVGLRLEEGLLAEIVADVLDEPGALPLLQYALTELHERREGTMLTRSAYDAIGGISGALVGRAEALFEGLNVVGKEAVRQLFLRLVTLGESADTRRRVERAELDSLDVDQGQLALAIDAFGASRLLSFDRDPRTLEATVEVAHEALLDKWGRLRDWITAERENLRAYQRLSAAAREWLEASRDPSFLLRGSQLARFESWAAESRLAQTELDRQYLEASVASRQAEEVAEAARRARETALERRSLSRLRGLVGVLAVAALVAAGLTVFAFDQSSRSKRQARIATARQLAAASVANLDVDPELSILLAMRAVETSPGGTRRALPEAVDALHGAIAASRAVVTIRTSATGAVAFSPDGSRVAAAGSAVNSLEAVRSAYVWDAATGKLMLSLRGATAPIRDIAYSPAGSRLVTGGDDGSIIVWNARTGVRLGVLPKPVHSGGVSALGFSSDGTRLAADGEKSLWIWDVPRRRLVRTIRSRHSLCGVAWSPDGSRVAAGDCGTNYSEASARIWNAATGEFLFATRAQTGAILDLAFSPDGRYLATPSLNGLARTWDARTGRLVNTFRGHTGQVTALTYSPNGRLIATSGTDGTARVWDVERGVQSLVLRGHDAAIDGLAFTPDGRRLATASEDGTVRIWDVTPEGSRDWLTLAAHPGGVGSAVYSPDGTRLLTAGAVDGKVKIWNMRTGALVRSYDEPAEVGAAITPGARNYQFGGATSADGTLTAGVQANGTAQVYDSATGDVRATLAARHGGVRSISFDQSGKRIATGNWDGTAIVWDVASGRPLRSFAAHKGIVEAVAFSPDGTLLATAGEDTTAKLWDLRTGGEVLTVAGHTFALTDVEFSPDGTRLATASGDGTVRVYVLPVDELIAVARSRLTRGWTKEECERYLPGRCPRGA